MTARPSFLFDVNRCTGCQACELACEIANGPTAAGWRRVRTFNPLHVPGVEQAHLSMACNHCDEAPCMEQCPADAYRRDATTGAVIIEADVCVGCRYCAWVCPYDAPVFDEDRGVMTKCTFCHERQQEGRGPACAESCPTGALSWSVLEPGQWTPRPAVPGFADVGTSPAIKVVDLHDRRRVPECTHPPAMPPWRRLWSKISPRITPAHEWPLVLFTWLLSWLVGWTIVGVLGDSRPPLALIVGGGGGGLLLSAAHLGRKERAWRATAGWRRSRLSREVALAGAFVAASAVWTWSAEPPVVLGWGVMLVGLALLRTVDAVYDPGLLRGVRFQHSALTFEAGLLAAAAMAGHLPLLGLMTILKLGLYIDRKRRRRMQGFEVRPLLTVLRCGLLCGGVGVMVMQGEAAAWLAVPAILAAELVDRWEFYDEIEIPTPDSLMLDELARRTSG